MTLDAFLQNVVSTILEPGLFLLFGIAFVIFVWGIVTFIRDADDAGGRETGKKNIIWGIVGMVIMVSVYGIIRIAYGTIGGNPNDIPNEGPFLPENTVENPL
ncbi:MAG: hypothetical protein AMXMBFR44_5950 [Candidatus Campbellbacteria bacterium]